MSDCPPPDSLSSNPFEGIEPIREISPRETVLFRRARCGSAISRD